jgi:hypothetical protein
LSGYFFGAGIVFEPFTIGDVYLKTLLHLG